MLNSRHKAVLFVTFVVTGAILLNGATVSEALGVTILGAAFAWLIGSSSAAKAVSTIRGRSTVWIKLAVGMAVGGALIAVVAIGSDFNSFLAATAGALVGLAVWHVRPAAEHRLWIKVLVWLAACALFLISAWGTAELMPATQESKAEVGTQLGIALLAIGVGVLWLSRGWQLILTGLTPAPSPNPLESQTSEQTAFRSWPHYVSVFVGAWVLAGAVAAHAFAGFSHISAAVSDKSSAVLPPWIGMMLLSWWPYSSWRTVLKLRPNVTPAMTRRHRRITLFLAALTSVLVASASFLGSQGREDREVAAKVRQGNESIMAIEAKIVSIKQRDLQTTVDYVTAYQELVPLLDDFQGALTSYSATLAEAQALNQSRGMLNSQLLYGPDRLPEAIAIVSLLKEYLELNRRQAAASQDMAKLASDAQPAYWEEHLKPLLNAEVDWGSRLVEAQKARIARK